MTRIPLYTFAVQFADGSRGIVQFEDHDYVEARDSLIKIGRIIEAWLARKNESLL